MSSIDERIVNMKLNNGQFQKNASDSLTALGKLKAGFNMDSAKASLAGLSDAAGRFSLGALSSGTEMIGSKFTALGVIGVTALATIANQAIRTGQQLVSSITTDPIMDGFNEYELKMGSIQTILANTSKQGTTLDQVKSSLEELNAYSDKTIYNFGDMTKNIGLFTNAGIGLQDATSMIKGFSNEAAASGTNSQQAAGAAYQLSQALSAGQIRLMDWRSLQNVGMGNKNMQSGIIEIAQAMGTMEAAGTSSEEVTQDFNGSLEKGWLSADVMSTYLKIMAGDMDAAAQSAVGLTDEQIAMFATQQANAQDAATKVRTWTQLIGTMQESVGSTWAQTFELLLGDFDKATEFFTYVNNTIGPLVTAAGNERNNLLQSWSDLGGRTEAIQALKNVFDALMKIMAPIQAAFRDIFPPATGEQVFAITQAIRKFTETLIVGEPTVQAIKSVFRGIFAILSIGVSVVKGILGVFGKLFGAIGAAGGNGGGLLTFLASIGEWLVGLDEAIKKGDIFATFFEKLGDILVLPVTGLQTLWHWLVQLATGFKIPDLSGFLDFFGRIGDRFSQIGDFFGGIVDSVSKFFQPATDAIKKFFDNLMGGGAKDAASNAASAGGADAGKKILDTINDILGKIGDTLANGDFSWIWDAVNAAIGVGLFVTIKRVLDSFKKIADTVSSGGGFLDLFKNGIASTFNSLTETMSAMQSQIKAGTLMKIAIAIALLTASVVALSFIDSARLTSALTGLTVMMGQLVGSLVLLEKFALGPGFAKMPVIIASLILLGVALNLVALAVFQLSTLDWNELSRGLVGLGVSLAAVVTASNFLQTGGKGMIKGAASLIIMGVAINVLAMAVRNMGSISWDDMIRGLVGIGAVLGGLLAFIKLAKIDATTAMSAIGLVGLAASVSILADAVKQFSALNPAELTKGLVAVGVTLSMIAIFLKQEIPDQKSLAATAAGMLILSGALWVMAQVVSVFAGMALGDLAQGMGALIITLVALTKATAAMPKNLPAIAAGLLILGLALGMITGAITVLGGMDLSQVIIGLVAMGGALWILTAAVNAVSGSVQGAAALALVAAALSLLVPALVLLGNLSIEQAATALIVLAGALGILLLAALGATYVLPGLIAISAAVLALGAAAFLAGLGVMLIGTGILALATAFVALAGVGAAGAAGITLVLQTIIAQIPATLVALAQGVVGFANVIITSGPTLIAAFVTVLGAMITAIGQTAPLLITTIGDILLALIAKLNEVIPPLIAFAVVFITTLVNALVILIPMLVDAGLQIIQGILQGIANNISGIVQAGVDIVLNFIGGIAAKIPDIIQSAINLMLSFIEGLARGIRENTTKVNNAVDELIDAIIDGMVSGLGNAVSKVAQKAADLANQALAAAGKALGIASPSKEFRKLGEYSGEGMAIGLENMNDRVADSSKDLGKGALSAMKLTMSRIGENVASNMDFTPTITPVLDMSNVKRGAGLVGGMFGAPTLSVDDAKRRADIISQKYNEARARAMEDGDPITRGDSSKALQFIQNNYSPRAIPTTEVYRQSNNQISRLRGVLKTK